MKPYGLVIADPFYLGTDSDSSPVALSLDGVLMKSQALMISRPFGILDLAVRTN